MSKHLYLQGYTQTGGMWAAHGLPMAFMWPISVSFHYPEYVLMISVL